MLAIHFLAYLVMYLSREDPDLRSRLAAFYERAGCVQTLGGQSGSDNGGQQYYDADYKVVDDDEKK